MPIRRVAKDPDADEGFQIPGSDSRLESESIIAGFFHREKKLRSKKDFVATAFVLSLRERKNTTVRSAARSSFRECADYESRLSSVPLRPMIRSAPRRFSCRSFARPSLRGEGGFAEKRVAFHRRSALPPNVRASVAHFIRPSVRLP